MAKIKNKFIKGRRSKPVIVFIMGGPGAGKGT